MARRIARNWLCRVCLRQQWSATPDDNICKKCRKAGKLNAELAEIRDSGGDRVRDSGQSRSHTRPSGKRPRGSVPRGRRVDAPEAGKVKDHVPEVRGKRVDSKPAASQPASEEDASG